MRTVEDEDGRRYLVEKRSAESSRVRDLRTGETSHLPNDSLIRVAGADPLEAVASAAPESARRRSPALRDARALGLLVLLGGAPRSVRALLEGTELCESDLLGLVSELRAAGLVEETRVDGERGYGLTEAGRDAVADNRGESAGGDR